MDTLPLVYIWATSPGAFSTNVTRLPQLLVQKSKQYVRIIRLCTAPVTNFLSRKLVADDGKVGRQARRGDRARV